MEAVKTCIRCESPKHLDDFNVSTHAKDGKQVYCRECCRVANAERARLRAVEKLRNPRPVKEVKQRYLCVNGNDEQAVPVGVASIVIKEWCRQNPHYSDVPGAKGCATQKPYNILAELAGVPVRRMFDLYHGIPAAGRRSNINGTDVRYKTSTIGIDALDKIITRGMDQPELWYAPPLDVYYLPLDEWTDEMRTRHAGN